LVGNQRERTTSSRGFLSFFVCLWQFCIVQILSDPKTFLYIFFLFSCDLWSGIFLPFLLSSNLWSGIFFFFLLPIFDRELSFSFCFLPRTRMEILILGQGLWWVGILAQEAASSMTCGGTVWLSTPFIILRRQARWHAGVPYGYPHLLSTRGEWACWRIETNVVYCTFRQLGANKPVDEQRDLHRLLHLLSSRGDELDHMWGYRMVIRTFHHPEAASPMTCGGTVWLSAPFVILKRQARWHAGVPYSYPHLLSTRGERAHWRVETNVVFCTFRQPWANKPVDA